MRKFLLTYIVIAGLISTQRTVTAQDAPQFSQFYANPFQFNPSYAAHNGYTEGNIFYRKQWVNIENAPTVGAFNIQTPVGRNVALALSGYSNKTILLRTNGVLATFAYRVNLGAEHHLNFGLSGGVTLNNFDLAAVEANGDPALTSAMQKSSFTNAQFGFNYQLKNFNIGFALPKLLESKPNSLVAYDKIKFDPFRNKFFSVSYVFKAGEFDITPMVLYRALDNVAIETQWEGVLMATWRKTIWAGVSYRDGLGVTGFVGIALKSFKVAFAYEHPTSDIAKATNGSQEFYLGARLGKRNRDEDWLAHRAERDSLRDVAKAEKSAKKFKEDSLKSIAEVPPVIAPVETPVEKPPVVQEPVVKENPPIVSTPVENKPPVVVTPPVEKPAYEPVKLKDNPTPFPDHKGFFIVFGAFKSADNAQKLKNSMRDAGIIGQVIFGEKRKYYYVYTYQAMDKADAMIQLQKARETKFTGVWIMSADKDLK